MQTVNQDSDPMGQIFALASGCDATQLNLTATEGYLLSRFDGSTPWRVLREMAGIPAADADSCLDRWIDEGLLEAIRNSSDSNSSSSASSSSAQTDSDGEESAPVDAAEAPSETPPAPQIDESKFDEGLDLDLSVQRRILEFEASLDQPYHRLLDVEKGSSDPKVIKRAYFKLSKEFHPDRYFRRNIGPYALPLERIFKKVLEAHEMLSDPDLCQVENQSSTPSAVETVVALPATEASPEPSAEKPKPLTKLERLRQRMPFKIDQAAIEARRAKAQEIFRAAEASQKAGRLQEAEANIRIAISFDPACSEFKEALGGLRIQAAGARATKLLATPSERMSEGELRDAWKLLEDVLLYRPHDPELNERAARVCLQLGKLDVAEEYAQTYMEGSPEVAGSHTLLGRIHRERGDRDAAVRAFERALKLDEEDLDARRALASVRLGARNEAQGGTA
jgi:tetratricopeptide (TPR) repeat protein